MPAGRNIQVYGIDGVLQWYKNAGIPAWAVVCDKNINAKYLADSIDEGYDMLAQYLEMLKKYDSAASYSLRMYEDVDKTIRINTPADMAFNFSLQEKGETAPASNLPAVNGLNNSTLTTLLREIADLKTENAVLKMEQEQDGDYIEELEKQLKAQPVAEEKAMGAVLLEKFMPTLVKWGEAIGERVFKSGQEATLNGAPISQQDDQALIDNAIAVLRTKLKRYTVGQVLSKIAETDQEKLDFYLTMLFK